MTCGLRNKHGEERPFRLSLTGDPALRVQLEGSRLRDPSTCPRTSNLLQRVYVVRRAAPIRRTSERTDVPLLGRGSEQWRARLYQDTIFNGKAINDEREPITGRQVFFVTAAAFSA